ncbi:SRPBCC family protein [Actinospica sp. MGRD01-02]|uniref:SRPBCC family protein n=1 Tax=Actinospica acidithermotolerans TaxID=2828514 RepID=A0A941IFT6_9ACTN|nr:SRPBCC family protein [Actinospica acidithermotolerans]MBR7826695.1 SRPBCC family protein [Actinospica acidithermotolerans]
MIKIEEAIPVPAPPDRVWAVVSDPSEVVSCIHGAELGEYHDDGSFDGALVVKFGAVRVKFGARLSLELDEPAHEGRLAARGRDGQGATRFSAQATFRVAEDREGGGSWVHMSGEVTLAGRLASVIEAGAGAVVARMTREFTEELVRRCVVDEAAAPVTVARQAPVRRSWWTALRAWWRRAVSKRQTEEAGSAR